MQTPREWSHTNVIDPKPLNSRTVCEIKNNIHAIVAMRRIG